MPSLVEIGPVVLEKKIFNFVNVFSLFRNYLPFAKGGALHLNRFESPSPKDTLCQVWLKLVQWFWSRRWKCEKFTTTTNLRQWLWQRTNCDQKAYLKLKSDGWNTVINLTLSLKINVVSRSWISHDDTHICQIWYTNVKANRCYGLETNTCQKPYKFDLEVI